MTAWVQCMIHTMGAVHTCVICGKKKKTKGQVAMWSKYSLCKLGSSVELCIVGDAIRWAQFIHASLPVVCVYCQDWVVWNKLFTNSSKWWFSTYQFYVLEVCFMCTRDPATFANTWKSPLSLYKGLSVWLGRACNTLNGVATLLLWRSYLISLFQHD